MSEYGETYHKRVVTKIAALHRENEALLAQIDRLTAHELELLQTIERRTKERDRARAQLVFLRSASHACDIKHIDAALSDEPEEVTP